MIQDGVTGLLYEPGNHSQLAERIERLIEHPREGQELAESGCRFVEETFTKERHGGTVHGVLAELKATATPTDVRPARVLNGADLIEAMFAIAGGESPQVTSLTVELIDRLHAKDSEVKRLRSRVEVKGGIVARADRIARRLAPPDTRRREYYQLVVAGARVIRDEGWRAFWSRFRWWCRWRIGV